MPSRFVSVWFGAACSLLAVANSAAQIDFNRDIRPILADRCFICHGPDRAANVSGLRLDQRESAIADLGNGIRAIVPGQPETSEIVRRVFSTDATEQMPPPDSGRKLSDAERMLLQKWVEEGAVYAGHWAFQPLPPAADPPPDPSGWSRNGIDQWVAAAHRAEGLVPSPEAPRWRWLRRVTLDLTGLPPTPEEIRAFEADERGEAAYTAVVDRLLASPAYGEHMALAWLDAARYADSFGYQADLLCTTWPWRDWVVRAFNENKPWDRFLTEQIAGDLLPDAGPDEILATGFNRLHRQTNEGGSIQEEWLLEYAADRVQTLGTAVLGMTIECARCHDHKFDPVSQRDYYSLLACFNSIDEAGTYINGSHVPTPSLPLPSDEQRLAIEAAERARNEAMLARDNVAARLGGEPFAAWLAGGPAPVQLPQPVATWSFEPDQAGGIGACSPLNGLAATVPAENPPDAGWSGGGIRFSGDAACVFPSQPASLEPGEQWCIGFRLWLPETLGDSVVLHRQQGTDTGFFGTELVLVDRRLRLASIRFWPGQAIAIQTTQPVPRGRWVHVVISNDGSASAAGLRLFIDGKFDCETLRDSLYKSPGVGDGGFSIGSRFRSTGIAGARLDEVAVYPRPLTEIEADWLARSQPGQPVDTIADASTDSDLWRNHFVRTHPDFLAASIAVSKATQALFSARQPVIEVMVMQELPTPRPTWVLARGAYDAPREAGNRVQRDTPACLPPWPPDGPRDRLGLARWLTSADHPLTARVAMNRFWQGFFGSGLVETPQDFGLQGAWPSHPALLDWLSRDFVDHGWDVKRLCRQIVLSATYRQDSVADPESRLRDPSNRRLTRGPAQRLTAEMLRDQALAASGLLNTAIGGPPVSPYQLPGLWQENNSMTDHWEQSTGRDLYRRSLYTVRKRTAPAPNMQVFDAPSREFCTVNRSPTNTPLQALVLLNDVQFVEACRHLAARAAASEPADPARQIRHIFLRLTGRQPDENELALLADVLEDQQARFSAAPDDAARLLDVGDSPASESSNPPSLAALTVVAQTVLGSDASVWKR